VANLIDSAFAPRAKNLARRKEGITGVSEFPNIGEATIVRPAPDLDALRETAMARTAAARRATGVLSDLAYSAAGRGGGTRFTTTVEAAEQGASIGQLALALGFHADPTLLPPLTPHPFAEPFEELRAASDVWQAVHGQPPRVFLANLGPVAHHTARATYAKNFFEAGGFDVISNDGFRDADTAARAFAASGATVAVLCSSDKLYPEFVPQAAPKLKAAGAHSVVLAGNPGANEAAWRASGVDRFIFIKCDVLGTLREMLHDEGVLV
jgi:methylmalonyl-CoA mutase